MMVANGSPSGTSASSRWPAQTTKPSRTHRKIRPTMVLIMSALHDRLHQPAAIHLFPHFPQIPPRRFRRDAQDHRRFPRGLSFGGPAQAFHLSTGQLRHSGIDQAVARRDLFHADDFATVLAHHLQSICVEQHLDCLGHEAGERFLVSGGFPDALTELVSASNRRRDRGKSLLAGTGHARGVPSGCWVIATFAHMATSRNFRIRYVLSGPSGTCRSITSE